MSNEVITIDDDDSVVCARCTFRNKSTASICAVCSGTTMDQQPPPKRVCQACTFANGAGAMECSICHMPLVDDVETETGAQMFIEDQGTEISGEQNLNKFKF